MTILLPNDLIFVSTTKGNNIMKKFKVFYKVHMTNGYYCSFNSWNKAKEYALKCNRNTITAYSNDIEKVYSIDTFKTVKNIEFDFLCESFMN